MLWKVFTSSRQVEDLVYSLEFGKFRKRTNPSIIKCRKEQKDGGVMVHSHVRWMRYGACAVINQPRLWLPVSRRTQSPAEMGVTGRCQRPFERVLRSVWYLIQPSLRGGTKSTQMIFWNSWITYERSDVFPRSRGGAQELKREASLAEGIWCATPSAWTERGVGRGFSARF